VGRQAVAGGAGGAYRLRQPRAGQLPTLPAAGSVAGYEHSSFIPRHAVILHYAVVPGMRCKTACCASFMAWTGSFPCLSALVTSFRTMSFACRS